MNQSRRRRRLAAGLPAVVLWVWAAAASAADRPSSAVEAEYLARNAAAMQAMHAGMAIQPRGDVDADFAAMMIAHHQGAIDMAVLELRYGRNVQLRRIAQEIIVEQQQEIAAMRLAVGEPLPPSGPAPTGFTRPAEPGPAPSGFTGSAPNGNPHHAHPPPEETTP